MKKPEVTTDFLCHIKRRTPKQGEKRNCLLFPPSSSLKSAKWFFLLFLSSEHLSLLFALRKFFTRSLYLFLALSFLGERVRSEMTNGRNCALLSTFTLSHSISLSLSLTHTTQIRITNIAKNRFADVQKEIPPPPNSHSRFLFVEKNEEID